MRATDAYWDQLMRTPAQVAEDHAQHERELTATRPPLTPIDQHAVMIRLLAEDNRANLDMFCERVDGLTKGLKDVRTETAGARTLFETEQEKVVGEIVELSTSCPVDLCAGIHASYNDMATSSLLLE
jgi:hypothetical protein